MRIFLELSSEQSAIHRSRLIYAFRLFCGVYGHQVLLKEGESADVWISYSARRAKSSGKKSLHLSSLCVPRSPLVQAPPPSNFERDGERTVLFYAPEAGTNPDWLAEIFEWVSCADEYSCRKRDVVGRVKFAESYVGRHNLDVRIPYAAVGMRFLQRALCQLIPGCVSEPACPFDSVRHFVINTHDVDFLPLSHFQSVRRLAKNSAISLLLYKSPGLALKQVKKALLAAVGGYDCNRVPFIAQEESRHGVTATFFFLTESRHRRDGNYRLNNSRVLALMRALERAKMEVGVHGSYDSLEQPAQLAREYGRLAEHGFGPKGSRQHWLRFSLDRLIPALEKAGALYDTSLGWPHHAGFRAGACFAFPPYCFDEERPATFLEIPLVLMDQNLLSTESDRYMHAAELISISRRYGWGGVSLLWHPTAFEGDQLPEEVGTIFWRLLDDRLKSDETWVSAVDFYQAVRQRYQQVGLLS